MALLSWLMIQYFFTPRLLDYQAWHVKFYLNLFGNYVEVTSAATW